MDNIASDFIDQAAPATSSGTDLQKWWDATDHADEIYRAIYGNQRADEYSRNARLDVLAGDAGQK